MIRLACCYCDRDDGDGLESIEAAKEAGWVDVDFVGESGPDSSNWWDHLGACPDCIDEHDLWKTVVDDVAKQLVDDEKDDSGTT